MKRNKVGLCKPPNLRHHTDNLVITIFSHCTECDRLIEVREAVSLNEMRQFRLGGKELRAHKLEKLYQQLAEYVNLGHS